LKFFGHMANYQPIETFSKYPELVDILLLKMESDNLTIVGVALETIAYIAETNEGKHALDFTCIDTLISFESQIYNYAF
jgi:Proteasome non-ATPase 26S subunit